LAGTVAPAGLLVWWFTRNLPALQRLIVEITILGIWTACMFLRYGLGCSLRADACRHAPSWAKPILDRMGFANPEDSDK
jgi:hypothetical protein